MAAEYDPETGEFTVSVNRILSWALISDGLFNGEDDPPNPDNHVYDVLPNLHIELPFPPWVIEGSVSNNANTVGEGDTNFRQPPAEDLQLGVLTEPGTPLVDPVSGQPNFWLEYVVEKGGDLLQGVISLMGGRAAGQESGGGETSSGQLAWLEEFQEPSTQSPPSQKGNPAAEAVDVLLASYGE